MEMLHFFLTEISLTFTHRYNAKKKNKKTQHADLGTDMDYFRGIHLAGMLQSKLSSGRSVLAVFSLLSIKRGSLFF